MQRLLPGIIAMAAIVVASNILVQFLILDGLLTWGAFTYPFAFLVTDLMNRIYGPHAARRVVFVGFLTGIICSLIGSQIMLQGDGYEYPTVALRIAVGSGTQIAKANADVVLMGDQLSNLPYAFGLAKKTMQKIKQNLIWAFGYNLIAIPIAAGILFPKYGILLTPSIAALLMATSSITVIINALSLDK